MAISDLLAVVPPPLVPDQTGSLDDLARCELQMGIQLLTDIREYSVRYGSGWFLDTYLSVKNPFVTNLVATTVEDGFCHRVYERGAVPWPQFPAMPGLLEFGGNENGCRLLFLVDGEPDGWPIVVAPHRAGTHNVERWELPFGTFLAKALLNEIRTAAVHTPDQSVEPHERVYTQYCEKWDLRDGKLVPKRRRR